MWNVFLHYAVLDVVLLILKNGEFSKYKLNKLGDVRIKSVFNLYEIESYNYYYQLAICAKLSRYQS